MSKMANYFLNIIKFGCLLSVVCCALLGCGDLDSTVTLIILSPLNPTIGINQSQSFSAIAKNSLGEIVSTTATWSSTGEGSISSTGFYIAGSSTGEAWIYATTGGVTASVTAIITDLGWIQGTVTDNIGNIVKDLKIYLGEDPSLFAFTDPITGVYTISSVPAGTYEVWTLETADYQALSQEVTVRSGQTKIQDLVVLRFSEAVDLNPPELTQ